MQVPTVPTVPTATLALHLELAGSGTSASASSVPAWPKLRWDETWQEQTCKSCMPGTTGSSEGVLSCLRLQDTVSPKHTFLSSGNGDRISDGVVTPGRRACR